jgi:prepilin-type processing-associated H-X9-DG protein
LHCNIGGLYPKYVAKQAKLFYCPSCKQISPDDPENGIPRLEYLTKFPSGHTGLDGPHNDPGACPMSAYVYARPCAAGKNPKDAGTKIYVDVLDTDIEDPANPSKLTYRTDTAASDWVAPISQAGRMRMPMPAFVTDAFFGGWEGSHLGGYNVLYADLHGKRVNDPVTKQYPKGIIHSGLGSGSGYSSGGMNGSTGRIFQVWDYFSIRP